MHTSSPGSSPPRPAARLALAGTGFARAFAELMIFGYLPIQLHRAGEERLAVLALIVAIPALVRFVSAGAWGALSSRTGRLKPYLLAGAVGYLGVLLLLPWVPSAAGSVALVGVGSLLFSALGPLAKSYVSFAGRGGLGRDLAGWLQAESLGWLAGGLAISLAGRSPDAFVILLGLAAGLVAVEVVLISVGLPEVCPAAPAGPARRELSLASLVRRPPVWVPLVSFALLTVASEGTFTLYGIYLTGPLGGGESLYGASITVATVLGILAYRAVGRLSHQIRPEVLLPAGAVTYAAVYLLMAGWKDPVALACLFSLPVYAFTRVGATWLLARDTSESERSAGMGLLDGGEAVAMALGSLAAGAAADRFGFAAVFAGFAAGALATALLSAWFNRTRRQPAAADPEPAAQGGAPGGRARRRRVAPPPPRRGSPAR